MKRGLIFLLVVLTSVYAKAQDNHYSQFYAAPLYLNPAMAGTKVCPRINFNFRDQWPNIAGTYISTTLSYDQYVSNFGGIGILINNDDAGMARLQTTQASVIYANKLAITRAINFSFGFEAGIYQKHLNVDGILLPDMIDPIDGANNPKNELFNDITKRVPDFSTGALLYGDNFFAGVAVHHLLEPTNILYGPQGVLYRRYTAHLGFTRKVGGKYKRKNKTEIMPQVIYQKQGPHQEFNVGVMARKRYLTGGIWYRGEDAAIIVAGVETKKFRFGLSYDVTLSKLTMNGGGAIELSLGYNFSCKPKRGLPPVRCIPSF